MKKFCKACKIEKPVSDFMKCKAIKDGYAGKCKDCFNSYMRSRKLQPKRALSSKTCSNCEVKKTIDEYPTCRMNSDGHTGKCRECVRTYLKKLLEKRKDDPIHSSRECLTCKQTKDASAFYQDPLFKGGLHSKCKGCTSVFNKIKYAQSHPTKQKIIWGKENQWKCRECKKCGETKDKDKFGFSRSCAGGLNSKCLECMKEYNRNYRKRRVS